MTTKLYRKGNKYLEVRRYDCGHYVWKQFTTYTIPECGKNYLGCSFRRCHKGTWHRVTKRWLEEVLPDYKEVKTVIY